MKHLIIIAILLFSTSAFARGYGPTQINIPKFSAVQKVQQTVNTHQKQGQQQGQNQGLSNDIKTIHLGRKNKRSPATAALAFMAPTSLCMGTVTAAGSMWLLGLGGGTTYEVDICMQGETIRLIGFMMQNSTDDLIKARLEAGSMQVLCMMKWAKQAPAICPQPEPDVPPAGDGQELDLTIDGGVEPKVGRAKLGDITDWLFGG